MFICALRYSSLCGGTELFIDASTLTVNHQLFATPARLVSVIQQLKALTVSSSAGKRGVDLAHSVQSITAHSIVAGTTFLIT